MLAERFSLAAGDDRFDTLALAWVESGLGLTLSVVIVLFAVIVLFVVTVVLVTVIVIVTVLVIVRQKLIGVFVALGPVVTLEVRTSTIRIVRGGVGVLRRMVVGDNRFSIGFGFGHRGRGFGGGPFHTDVVCGDGVCGGRPTW